MRLSATSTRITGFPQGGSGGSQPPDPLNSGILFNGILLVYNGEPITYNQP